MRLNQPLQGIHGEIAELICENRECQLNHVTFHRREYAIDGGGSSLLRRARPEGLKTRLVIIQLVELHHLSFRVPGELLVCPSQGTVNGLIQKRGVIGVLLQQRQPVIQSKYTDIGIRRDLVGQKILGGLGRFSSVHRVHSLENQRHQIDFAQRLRRGSLGSAGRNRLILPRSFSAFPTIFETSQRLRRAVFEHFDLVGPEVHHQLLVLIARNEIEQDFLPGGVQNELWRACLRKRDENRKGDGGDGAAAAKEL